MIPFRKPLQEVYVRNVLAILEQIEPLEAEDASTDEESEDDA